MGESRQRIYLRRFKIAYGIGALVVYALLIAFSFSWWHASNHPVKITMGADSSQQMQLQFAKGESPLKLVPLGNVEDYHWTWGTELPPRAKYDLALVFPDGTTGEVLLKEVEVTRLAPEKKRSLLLNDSVVDSEDGSVRINNTINGALISAKPGGVLPVEIEFPVLSPYEWLKSFFHATVGYLIAALAVLLMIVTLLRFPDNLVAYRKRAPAAELAIVVICVAIGAWLHIQLVRNSMPDFEAGSSEHDIILALEFEKGIEHVNHSGYLPARPGYAYFLSQILSPDHKDLSSVALTQAIIFSLAMLLLGLACTRLVQGYFIGPVVMLAMLSPPAVWASRHIGEESLVVSFWILALAIFIWMWKRSQPTRWVGFVLFGIIVSYASTVSVMGLLLMSLPLSFVIGTLWWCISIRGVQFFKLPLLWKTFAQCMVSVVILIATSVTMIWMLPGAASMTSIPISESSAPFVSGMFDVRSVGDGPAYNSLINERFRSGYRYDGPAMSAYQELPSASRDLLPLRAKLVGWGRLSAWAIFFPNTKTYAMDSLVPDYNARLTFRSRLQGQNVRDAIAQIMRETGEHVQLLEKRHNKWVALYNNLVVPKYRFFYRILFIVAIAGWLIGLSERKYLASVFMIPFLLNIVLHVYMLHIKGGEVQSLDSFLWLSAVCGLAAADRKSLQKHVDETDRRFLSVVRPKRLFTRFDGMRRGPHVPLGRRIDQ
ncbi:MAG: hypothetical protein AB3N63_02045 [Puniceicoccaceae bacterium]